MSDQRIFDYGEIVQWTTEDGDEVMAVVLRCDGQVLRIKELAACGEAGWEAVPDELQEYVLLLHTLSSISLVPETQAADMLSIPNVPRFREWWSGRPAGRR